MYKEKLCCLGCTTWPILYLQSELQAAAFCNTSKMFQSQEHKSTISEAYVIYRLSFHAFLSCIIHELYIGWKKNIQVKTFPAKDEKKTAQHCAAGIWY